jgi:hypothetical protein
MIIYHYMDSDLDFACQLHVNYNIHYMHNYMEHYMHHYMGFAHY